MMKFIFLILLMISALNADFKYYDVHTLNEFEKFKVYKPKGRYLKDNLNIKRGNISRVDKKRLNELYSYEKMVRDLLLVLSKKYDYNFMQYIAMLTHTQLLTLDMFYEKYNLKKPETLSKVGIFKNNVTTKRYKIFLKDSLIEDKTAAKLSVMFMKELVGMYDKTLKDLPKGLKRQLLKTNAFNKKILRMFKKGLRNIELGLPVE